MSDLNKLFSKFNGIITLSTEKTANLKTGRDAIREKIRKKFKENGRSVPKFHGQGSFMMKTTVNPLTDEEYDIDDGVYLSSYNDKPQEEWATPLKVHTWIKDAVDGHTGTPPLDKNTCVRVIYAKNYHIDLPSYIIKNDIVYLAHKREGWTPSDPKAFTDWFLDKVNTKGEQLRSLVKYLKAWKDFENVDLKSIVISILVAENFYSYTDRDEKALLGTVTNIYNKLNWNFICKKPVVPNEDLLDGLSETKKDGVLNALKSLKESLDNAINSDDEEVASDYLIKSFGDRFPKGEAKKSERAEYVRTNSPVVFKNDGHSA